MEVIQPRAPISLQSSAQNHQHHTKHQERTQINKDTKIFICLHGSTIHVAYLWNLGDGYTRILSYRDDSYHFQILTISNFKMTTST